MKKMSFKDVVKHISEIFPNASFGDDNDGQLLIYTDMKLDAQDNIIPLPLDIPETSV